MSNLFDLLSEGDLIYMPSNVDPKDLAECFWACRAEELGEPWHHSMPRRESAAMLKKWIASRFVGGVGWDYSGPRTKDEIELCAWLMAPYNNGGTVYAEALRHIGRCVTRGGIDVKEKST
jgi:hypothetical protein